MGKRMLILSNIKHTSNHFTSSSYFLALSILNVAFMTQREFLQPNEFCLSEEAENSSIPFSGCEKQEKGKLIFFISLRKKDGKIMTFSSTKVKSGGQSEMEKRP